MELPKELKDKAKGRQAFQHNGQTIYEWDQNIEDVNIYINPPKFVIPKYKDEFKKSLQPGEKLPELEIKITSTHLKIGIKGNPPFLDEDLGGQVKASDSFWMIEDEELHIQLQKMHKAETWNSALKGHQALDPITQNEVQKSILLERFQEENPGFDFSGAEVNGMVPDPKNFMGGVNNPLRNFTRYFNRGELQAQTSKFDLTSYQYKPDLIYNIDPAPQFPDQPNKPPRKNIEKSIKFKQYLERYRTNSILKSKMQERFQTGRLFAHIKHEELKQSVQEIHQKEKQSTDTDSQKDIKTFAKKIDNAAPDFEIDDQFKLPYGLGYDHVIKKKADMTNSQKVWNNKVMDELIDKLGYMDYRDALACNKYILEAKRHGDYHQQARAKVLSYAMNKYNQQKKQEIEKKAAAQTPSSQLDKDENKLKTIMNEDPQMALLYQEIYGQTKKDREAEFNQIKRIHDKFDYLKDGHTMNNKILTDKYDVTKEKPTVEEEIVTTELSDSDLDALYKRYKIMTTEQQDEIQDPDAMVKKLIQDYKAGRGMFEGEAVRTQSELQNAIGIIYAKRMQKKEYKYQIENYMAMIRIEHDLKNIKLGQLYAENDPFFPNDMPDSPSPDKLNDYGLEEIRKLNYAKAHELQRLDMPVYDEESQADYEHYTEMRNKYFKAKLDHHVKKTLDRISATTVNLEQDIFYNRQFDQLKEKRAEFMYSYLDYDNDRTRVREKFINEMNKKTSLQDIGEMLDKFIIDEKAEGLKYYQPSKHVGNETEITSAKKDTSNFDLHWSGRLMKELDPLQPSLFDDPSMIDEMPEGTEVPYKDIMDRVKFQDEHTDHSYRTLTPDERSEIALFHSFKQDPYFKHYLYNHLRQQAEEVDEGTVNFPHGPYTNELIDHAKFDRINLYDFRRALPQKERQAKLDKSGCAWGFGKRKTSHAVVRVKPGKGEIKINGKPMLEYFHMPSQRYRMLLPLSITQYTCLLDVDIWLHGGGLTGQCEAVIPALAKAIQHYDVKTRPILKFFRLMRHDPRQVERKKFGRLKARKGQVYRRR